jgi:hypothetical protein
MANCGFSIRTNRASVDNDNVYKYFVCCVSGYGTQIIVNRKDQASCLISDVIKPFLYPNKQFVCWGFGGGTRV